MRAGSGLAPRQRVNLMLDREAEQLVPVGMELDLVDAVAEAIVRPKPRRVLVRQCPQAPDLGATRQLPDRAQPVARRVAAFATDRLDQRQIGLIGAVVGPPGGLV